MDMEVANSLNEFKKGLEVCRGWIYDKLQNMMAWMQTMALQVSIVLLITESEKSVAEKMSLYLLWFLHSLLHPLCYCSLCTTENNLFACKRLQQARQELLCIRHWLLLRPWARHLASVFFLQSLIYKKFEGNWKWNRQCSLQWCRCTSVGLLIPSPFGGEKFLRDHSLVLLWLLKSQQPLHFCCHMDLHPLSPLRWQTKGPHQHSLPQTLVCCP